LTKRDNIDGERERERERERQRERISESVCVIIILKDQSLSYYDDDDSR
jgi:hypothetical protein